MMDTLRVIVPATDHLNWDAVQFQANEACVRALAHAGATSGHPLKYVGIYTEPVTLGTFHAFEVEAERP